MRTYDAGVRVSVTSTYYVVLEVEAADPAEAEEKLKWQALGLSRQELDRLCDGSHGSSNSYEGSETTVDEVGQVGPPGWAPEDGPMEDHPTQDSDAGDDPREAATPGR